TVFTELQVHRMNIVRLHPDGSTECKQGRPESATHDHHPHASVLHDTHGIFYPWSKVLQVQPAQQLHVVARGANCVQARSVHMLEIHASFHRRRGQLMNLDCNVFSTLPCKPVTPLEARDSGVHVQHHGLKAGR